MSEKEMGAGRFPSISDLYLGFPGPAQGTARGDHEDDENGGGQ